MMDKLGFFLSFTLILGGAVLLYDPISGLATSQPLPILAGATLLTLGLVTAFYLIKGWWRWKQSKPVDSAEMESGNPNHV